MAAPHARRLKQQGDWLELASADEQKPAKEGTVEAWGRSPKNPVGGWYGLKKGLRGRFGMHVPPVMEALGLAVVEHNPKNNRMRLCDRLPLPAYIVKIPAGVTNVSSLDHARATQLKNIESKTGKTIVELRAIIKGTGLTRHGEIRGVKSKASPLGLATTVRPSRIL